MLAISALAYAVSQTLVTGSLIAGTSFPSEGGYQEAFAISAVVLIGAAFVALNIPRPGRGAEAAADQRAGTVPVRA